MDIREQMLVKSIVTAEIFSKDNSTKTGAIILDENDNIYSTGYNGIPRGMNDGLKNRNTREANEVFPLKYNYFEHAERNALYNISHVKNVFLNTVLLTNEMPDIEEFRAIVSSGIKFVICNKDYDNLNVKEFIQNCLSETEILFIPDINKIKNESDILKLKDNVSHETIEFVLGKLEKIKKHFYIMGLFNDDLANIYQYRDTENEVYKKAKSTSILIDMKSYSEISTEYSGITLNLIKRIGKNDFDENRVIPHEYRSGSIKNVIFYTLSQHLSNKTLIASHCPCINCAKAIISTGINHVVTEKLDFENNDMHKRWQKSFNTSKGLFQMFKVKFNEIEISNESKIKINLAKEFESEVNLNDNTQKKTKKPKN